jgi:hypothetical protein
LFPGPYVLKRQGSGFSFPCSPFFPRPRKRLRVNRRACPSGRHQSPRPPHPCSPLLTYLHSPHALPSDRPIESHSLSLFLAPGERDRNGALSRPVAHRFLPCGRRAGLNICLLFLKAVRIYGIISFVDSTIVLPTLHAICIIFFVSFFGSLLVLLSERAKCASIITPSL